MQKWSPEPFGAAATTPPRFEGWDSPVSEAWRPLADESESGAPHMAELPTLDPLHTLREDLESEYTARKAALAAEADAAVTACRQAFEERWKELADRLAETASTVVLAAVEKIVRDIAAVDRRVLVRNIETVLYKIQDGLPVTVHLNPDDTEWLSADGEISERLGIENVVSDRRIARGGCRVTTENGAWDATIDSQIAQLAALLDGAFDGQESTRDP